MRACVRVCVCVQPCLYKVISTGLDCRRNTPSHARLVCLTCKTIEPYRYTGSRYPMDRSMCVCVHPDTPIQTHLLDLTLTLHPHPLLHPHRSRGADACTVGTWQAAHHCMDALRWGRQMVGRQPITRQMTGMSIEGRGQRGRGMGSTQCSVTMGSAHITPKGGAEGEKDDNTGVW